MAKSKTDAVLSKRILVPISSPALLPAVTRFSGAQQAKLLHMGAHFTVFKGAPRWRDPYFWMFLAFFSALLGWDIYRGKSLWSFLIWSPLYAPMLMRPRLFLGDHWLFYLGTNCVFHRLQRFEHIESYTCSTGVDKEENVQVTLTLIRTKGPRVRLVWVALHKCVQLDAFIAAMQARGVPNLEEHFHNILADLPSAVFSPPFSSVEAEREALYRLLNRPMPKN